MPVGRIKWFNDEKGYGFIEMEDGSKDVYFHRSAVEGGDALKLRDGDRVSFDVVTDAKGLKAVRVTRM
jgi:CspA family cold shock protein